MEAGKLVGIITETDIFKVFLELLGAREKGLRLTIEVPRAERRNSPHHNRDRASGGKSAGPGFLHGRRPFYAGS